MLARRVYAGNSFRRAFAQLARFVWAVGKSTKEWLLACGTDLMRRLPTVA